MITEDYCPKDLYKLLLEKGFDGEIRTTYDEEGYTQPSISLYVAMKWLREHTIDIVITPSMFHGKYNVCIYKDENLCCVDFDGATLSPSYEYACKTSIKFCLENLI